MKKFFSKIGKGFKKVLKGIGKVLNSKIGKIIGTVFMAYSIGSLFSKMFTKGAAVVGDVAATGVGDAVVTEGAKQAVTEGAAGVAETAAAKLSETVVGQTGKAALGQADALVVGAGETITKGVTDQALKVGSSMAEAGADKAYAALTEGLSRSNQYGLGESATLELFGTATDAAVAGVQNNGTMIADALEGKIIPHSVAQTPEMLRSPSLLSPLEQAPDPEIFGKGLPTNKIVGTEHVLSSEGLKAPFTSDELKAIINNDHGVATASKLDYASTGGTWKDLSPDATTQQITERNLEMAFARSRPTTIQNALADPAFRTPYDTSFAGNVSGTLKHPEMYGAREFTSFGDAWQSGGSLLERGGNIFQHATGTSVGELTDGAYTGFGSTRSAAGTAFTGAQYALAATADAPEEPVAPNYMARSMAKYELEKADPFTGPIDAQALTSQVDWSAPSNIYMNQMQNVINATGAPYLYGPTDFNFGHPRYQGAGGSFGGGGATGDY